MNTAGVLADLEEMAHALRTHPVLDYRVDVSFGPEERGHGDVCTEVVEYRIVVAVRRPVRNCHGHDTPDPGGA